MRPLQREALQMCLEYIETDAHERRHVRWKINEALAEQPAPEPVGLRDAVVVNLLREGINKHRARELADHLISLTPPPPQRKPLTDEQIRQCFRDLYEKKENWLAYARAIEAAHNIKEHT